MYKRLMKDIIYAKSCLLPIRELYEVHGKIKMAFELNALSLEEYLTLETECVRNGINNSVIIRRDGGR